MRRSPSSTLFPYTTLFRSPCRRRLESASTLPSRMQSPPPGFWQQRLNTAETQTLCCIGSNAAERLCFRSEEHTSELQSLRHLVCCLLHEKKKIVTDVAQGN